MFITNIYNYNRNDTLTPAKKFANKHCCKKKTIKKTKEKKVIPPGFEPGTLSVLDSRDNHYTTESDRMSFCSSDNSCLSSRFRLLYDLYSKGHKSIVYKHVVTETEMCN